MNAVEINGFWQDVATNAEIQFVRTTVSVIIFSKEAGSAEQAEKRFEPEFLPS
jgi:hypothetical protein